MFRGSVCDELNCRVLNVKAHMFKIIVLGIFSRSVCMSKYVPMFFKAFYMVHLCRVSTSRFYISIFSLFVVLLSVSKENKCLRGASC